MDAGRGQGNNNARCGWCGRPVSLDSPYALGEERFCCEGCYLGRLAQQQGQEERDQAYLALAESLVAALDAREHETGMHSKRVACHTQVLARQVSDDEGWLRQVYWGALLHDIGKIAIPDAILLKAGPLSEAEWAVMRSHPQRGHDILAGVPFMREAAAIVLHHEERFDGSGYPAGLAGEAIPWGARLFALIDTLDAITSDRPYRRGMPFDTARDEIRRQAGRQFDPRAVELFLAEEATLREMVMQKCTAPQAPPW
ncbi:HD domain-containing phosphohydrolase [Thiohalobacter sp. IOR34]|uniref:HD-GYP domain-containing protein n=1 Tax=Thiohalobacter sp. IOR34 TaxID=3057176 RepID=UPI0025AEDE60|nr:HD domain-containing phosphohydrolase [Thiohalobacter sp. IOR34]WJW74271.1 HD domain-containing phosphohydrolase [Thiohalobacter sp. IOR34]